MTLIKEVNGDLLEAPENLILHQVNCQGKMGSGIADQVKKKWFNVYRDYKGLTDRFIVAELIGHAQVVGIGNKQAVVNLFGQKNYGYDGERYTDYEGLFRALEKTAQIARKYNLSVALPYGLGSDRGGASWSIVYTMIEEVFKNHTQPIVIYKLGGKWEHSFGVNPQIENTVYS